MSIRRLVDPAAARKITYIRCPELPLPVYFRVAALAHARGLLDPERFRLLDFLQRQDVDPHDGRVIGMRQTDQTSGGMDLARRYALAHGVGDDRFWTDLKGLYQGGWAEQVVKPAPGRRAAYALCLRADAIPQDLPEDLARALRVWALPEPVDAHEDTAHGRLTGRQAVPVERIPVPARTETVRELAGLPRWEHPAGSKAAAVAGTIRESGRILPPEARPRDLRCFAVATPTPGEAVEERVRSRIGADGKTSPSYARGFQLSGLSSADRRGLSWFESMETTKTTPSAAPTRSLLDLLPQDLTADAAGVRRRVWHSWRAQLGHGEVILTQPDPEAASRSLTGSAWDDLLHVIAVALRRGATPALLIELLTTNIVRHDQWGKVTWKASNVGRLAAHRLWTWINAHPNAPQYTPRTTRPQASHVTAWDDSTDAEIAARLERKRRAQADRGASLLRAEAERAQLTERWQLRRWAQEPETAQREALYPAAPAPASSPQSTHAAALARSRAEKLARRRAKGAE
ncbi:hypothetical protein [Streptomyces sp. NPDC047525]|uniref:hypothetical protein n=1 Tax=Streptomyces sp. NPDC047525 TaxID=3155264 RepID=UPI00340A8B9E